MANIYLFKIIYDETKKELEASGFFYHLIEENKKLCSCIENIPYMLHDEPI